MLKNKTNKEIEFVCANEKFPKFCETLKKHKELYNIFKKKKGLLPYRQDFTGVLGKHKELSFAVIILDKKMKPYVEEQARKIGLKVDLISEIPEWKINEIKEGKLEYQIKKLNEVIQ